MIRAETPISSEMDYKGIYVDLWNPPEGTSQLILDAMPGVQAIPVILELILGIPSGTETEGQIHRAISTLNELRKGICQDLEEVQSLSSKI